MPDNSIAIQPVENIWTSDANQQLVISKNVTIKKTLKEILNGINKQVMETKYKLNLGQLLWVILVIKLYILNLVPSKLILLEPAVASIAMDHQMAMIQVQVGKNFIEYVLGWCFWS